MLWHQPHPGISIFLVDTTTEGFKKGQNLDKIGLKAQDTSELFFEDMRVPHSAVLGGDAGLNRGFMMMMEELPQERLLIAAMGVASAEVRQLGQQFSGVSLVSFLALRRLAHAA